MWRLVGNSDNVWSFLHVLRLNPCAPRVSISTSMFCKHTQPKALAAMGNTVNATWQTHNDPNNARAVAFPGLTLDHTTELTIYFSRPPGPHYIAG